MNWDDLRYFLAVARAGSFVGAGTALSVSHTTVSRRMTSFEDGLGVRLFERLPTGLILTVAGERLLDTARETEHSIVTAERQLAGRDTRLFGSLRVTVPYLLAEHVLMDHIAGFTAKYPDIEVELVAAHELLSLTRREVDVAIRVTNRPPDSAIGRHVATLSWAMYVDERAYRRHRRRKQPLPLVGLDDPHPLPEDVRTRFPDSRVHMRVNDHLLLLHAVRSGIGAGAVPRFIGDSDTRLRHLCPMPSWNTDVWLLTHRDLRGAARVRVFMEFIHRAVRADDRFA